MTRIHFTLLSLILLMACKTPQATQGGQLATSALAMQELKQAAYCGVEEKSLQVIQEAAQWESLWGQITSITMPAPPLPQVDFEQQMVIAYFLGTQNSGGHAIEIGKVEVNQNVLTVEVTHTSAGKNCMLTSALTQPYCLVAVPKTAHTSAKAELRAVVEDC